MASNIFRRIALAQGLLREAPPAAAPDAEREAARPPDAPRDPAPERATQG